MELEDFYNFGLIFSFQPFLGPLSGYIALKALKVNDFCEGGKRD